MCIEDTKIKILIKILKAKQHLSGVESDILDTYELLICSAKSSNELINRIVYNRRKYNTFVKEEVTAISQTQSNTRLVSLDQLSIQDLEWHLYNQLVLLIPYYSNGQNKEV